MRTFKSKISPLFASLLAIELLAMMLAFWFHNHWLGALLIIICTNDVTRLVQTEYRIDSNNRLEVIRGRLQRPLVVDIADIATVKQGRLLVMGEAALSPRGVWITLTSGKTLFVSPLDCDAFIARLVRDV